MAYSSLASRKRHLLNGAIFLVGFLDTLTIYIASSYFAGVTGNPSVGLFYLLAYGGGLALIFWLQPLIRRLGRARALYFALCSIILVAALLTRLDFSYLSAGLLVAYLMVGSIVWVMYDVLLEGFSEDAQSGTIRGVYLTLMNLGVLLAPFLATAILERQGYQGVFFAALVGYIGLFLYSLLAFRQDNFVSQPRVNLLHAMRATFASPALGRIYLVNLALNVFYAVMTIYMPLRLLAQGFDWQDIGLIFTIMLVPFVLLQYPLGVLADRRYGEKELLLASLLLAAAATAALAQIDSGELWVWAAVLFVSRIGIAAIELLKDAYFFRHVSAADIDIIAFFRTPWPAANIFVAALSAGMLAFLPFASVFYLMAGVLLLTFGLTLSLRDSQSARERGR